MKTIKSTAVAISLAFSISLANQLSKSCMDEFVNLPQTQKNFSVEDFLKKLPVEVVKVKAQAKLPFGKPADSKETEIGITVGCLKQFPESAAAIAPLLKSLSVEMAKNMATNKSGAVEKSTAEKSSSVNRTERRSVDCPSLPEKKLDESKDVIYLRSGKEIKNTAVIEIGLDEVKYRVGTRRVAYAIRKSDISTILYADGEKELFCNGILYDSETHFCHADGKTYSCGDEPYNPVMQSCSDNVIYEKCNNKPYNSATHFCHTDGKTYSCGGEPYNPAKQSCYNNSHILDKCGGKDYNSATHFCHTDGQTYSCGNKPYNPEAMFCVDDTIYRKCGEVLYNPITNFCHTDGNTYSCGGKPYNPEKHVCKDNTLYKEAKCGNKLYDSATHFCHTDGNTYSCGNKPYNPATHGCEWSSIFKRR